MISIAKFIDIQMIANTIVLRGAHTERQASAVAAVANTSQW